MSGELPFPTSPQRGHSVGPGLDGGLDRVVLVGRDPDGLPGEGDVVVVPGRVVALELTVAGLLRGVAEGFAGHRGVREGCDGVRVERSDRRGLERDRPDLLAGVDEVHSSRCSAPGAGRPPASPRRL